jgi:Zn-dependent peptidase ImmA (M78 family)/transcriptional regulator with XRE-family HTH domain
MLAKVDIETVSVNMTTMTSAPTSALAINLLRIRTAKGLSQVELADRSGLSRVGYRNIEAGKSEPRAETLTALARALDVPIEQLLIPVRPLHEVRFRAQKKLHSRDEVLANVARQLDHYSQLEELLALRTSNALEKARKSVAALRGSGRIPEAARVARDALGLRENDSIRDICGLLEDHGIKVLTPAVATDGFFGLSVGNEDGGPAIAVNTWERITVERWIFTAAHELGHLLFHLDSYEVGKTEENETEEKEADIFAAHFLMPDHLFRKELEEVSGLSWYDRVFKLKRLFRVSYRTVLYRIASDMPPAQRKNVWIRFNAEYKRSNGGRSLPGTVEPQGLPPDAFFRRPAEKTSEEPERLDRHDFMQDRFARLVRRALEQDAITLSKAAEILELDLDDMRELSNSWVD